MRFPGYGFSLVEVTISLGIISFCILSIFALLPVGMTTIQDSKDRRNAVEVMNGLAGEFLTAEGDSSAPSYRLSGSLSNISWQIGGGVVTESFAQIVDNPQTEELKVWLEIAPPVDKWSCGAARISVAWPASALRAGSAWEGAKGSVHTIVYFNP